MGCAGARPRLRSELERLFLLTASRGSAMAGAAREGVRSRHGRGGTWTEAAAPPRGSPAAMAREESSGSNPRGEAHWSGAGPIACPESGRPRCYWAAVMAAVTREGSGGAPCWCHGGAGCGGAEALAAPGSWCVPPSPPLSRAVAGAFSCPGCRAAPLLTLSLSPLQRPCGRGRAACGMRGSLRGSLSARTR